jgi:hypothetical protein
MYILVIFIIIAFSPILFFMIQLAMIDGWTSNDAQYMIFAAVAGPEYCPPSAYFDSELKDCL